MITAVLVKLVFNLILAIVGLYAIKKMGDLAFADGNFSESELWDDEEEDDEDEDEDEDYDFPW